ncbi:MAG: GspE/PulE family protein [Bacteroidota bacterium]
MSTPPDLSALDDRDDDLVVIEGSNGTTTVAGAGAGLVGSPEADGMAPLVRHAAPPPADSEGLAAAKRDRVVAHMLRRELVKDKHVREAFNQWRRKGEQDTLWRWLARHPDVDTEAVFAEASRIYAFPQARLGDGTPDPAFVKAFVEALPGAQQDQMLAFGVLPVGYEIDPKRRQRRLVLAAQDPGSPDVIGLVHAIGLEPFDLRYAPNTEIRPLLTELFPRRNEFLERAQSEQWAYDLGATFDTGSKSLVDEDAIEAEINRSGLINLFEACLVEGVRLGVSDIHIWPNADRQTEFHFRIDGELQHWHTEDKVHPEALLAVVKDKSGNVDRFERETAQDGYIQRHVDGTLIRYRVSVLPIATADRGVRAESVVIRVLDDRKVITDMGTIGLLPNALEAFTRAIRQPHGMVILTGPTGSGKSTTLVAALSQVVRPQINALTIEDPVEYIIRGVRQIKLGPRLDMESALRSVLRHDPDIVMVGEMRDRETAELAVKLANTGHLTFSTLHTNDAPSAVSRLYKMGLEPFLIAYAINLVVAQRLIRTLCDACKRPEPDPDLVMLRELGFSDEEIRTVPFYAPGDNPDCPKCKGVGYRGRRAIAEALYFSRAIRHLIVKARGDIDEDAIRDQAVRDGMLTLAASAREIVKLGQTSIDEVLRVTTSED